MELKFNFMNVKSKSKIKQHAIKRLMKPINQLDPTAIGANIRLVVEKERCIAKCNFIGSKGLKVQAGSTTSNIYYSIDLLAMKLEKQIKKYVAKSRIPLLLSDQVDPKFLFKGD